MNKIKQFLFAQRSAWTLAGLRIGTGLLLVAEMTGLIDWIIHGRARFGFPVHLFVDQASYRIDDGFRLAYAGLSWFPVPSFTGFGLLETSILVLAIAWTIGLVTRITGPLLWFSVVYLFGVSQFFYSHSLLLFVLTLGVLVWSPVGRVWSIDQFVLYPQSRPVSVYPLRLLQILVSIIYVSVGIQRLVFGWTDGVVPRMIQSLTDAPRIVEVVMNISGGYTAFAWISSLLLILFAGALWHRTLRRGVLVIGIVMHIVASFVLDMGPFHYQMIVLYVAFFATLPSTQTSSIMQQPQQQQ